MAKKNVLFYTMKLFLITATVVIGSSKDPKIAELLQPPHPHRVNQNIRIHVPAITPPRSPRPQKIYEKAVHTFKQQPKNRLNPRG